MSSIFTEPEPAAIGNERSYARLYGMGIFTTLAVHGGEPFLWQKHWRRLTADALKVGITLAVTEDEVHGLLCKAILSYAASEARARISFFDERPSELWSSETGSEQNSSLSVLIGDRRPVTANFRLTVSPYPVNSRSPLTGVKSCNYLENLMAFEEAKERGFDEAVRLNERGEVASACMANVFWLRDDVLFTPSLKTGCLPGTTREFVMENIGCREVDAGVEVLSNADALFLTSAGLGVVRAAQLDEKTLPGADHPILRLIPSPRSG